MGWTILPAKDARDAALQEKKKLVSVNLMTNMLTSQKITVDAGNSTIAVKSLQGGLN